MSLSKVRCKNVIIQLYYFKNILIKEHIRYNDINQIAQNVFNFSNGDLRKTITLLQRSAYVSKLNNCEFNGELIEETASLIPNILVNELYEILINKLDDYRSE